MIEILAQMTVGEGVAVAGGGSAVTLAAIKLIGVVVNRGLHAKLDVGDTKENGSGKPKECPLHAPLVKQMDEREINRQRDHKETVDGIIALRTSMENSQASLRTTMEDGLKRVHERIDKALSGK